MKRELKGSPKSCLPPVPLDHLPHPSTSTPPPTPSSKLWGSRGDQDDHHHEEAYFPVKRVFGPLKRVLPSGKITTMSELILQMTQAPSRDLPCSLNSEMESVGMVTLV